MYTRIRFINVDGSVSVLDLAFSQVVAALQGLTREQKDAFWDKQETKLADGRSAFMFKHACGWSLNACILRLITDHAEQCIRDAVNNKQDPDYLFRIVREEIAQDRTLVWC